MLGAALEMHTSTKWRAMMLEKPEIWGLESLSAEAIVVRLVIKTRTSAKDDVARELRLRLKRALDLLGVDLPPLNSIVFNGLPVTAPPKPRGARTAPTPVQKDPAPAKAASPKTSEVPTREMPKQRPSD